MDNTNMADVPLVTPVVDETEPVTLADIDPSVIDPSSIDASLLEAEEAPQERDLPLDTAEQEGLAFDAENPLPPLQAAPQVPLPARPGLPPEPGSTSTPGLHPAGQGLRRDLSLPPPAPLNIPLPDPPIASALSATASASTDTSSAPPTSASPSQLGGDALSLQELKRLVEQLPQKEFAPYAFTYDDAASFEEEIEEWFGYGVEEQANLLKAYEGFRELWEKKQGKLYEEGECDWSEANKEERIDFVRELLEGVQKEDQEGNTQGQEAQQGPQEPQETQSTQTVRLRNLEALVYVLLGCWVESAGRTKPSSDVHPGEEKDEHSRTAQYANSAAQVELIRKNARLVVDCGGLPILFDILRSGCYKACEMGLQIGEADKRFFCGTMAAMYTILEVARTEEKEKDDLTIRSKILSLNDPGLFMLMIEMIEKMRWEEASGLPMIKIFLLAWKTILVSFGGLKEVDRAKESFADKELDTEDERGHPIITASPLDYHVFRQEISSKYPAYNPPPNLFPLEPENNSILPPLKNHPNKNSGNHVFGSGLADIHGNSTSIFQQPIHIATPAPSPPPSPAGPGGKGGKKQNYQTNQMFPFLYPPLDASSNNLGGKGSTDLQDLLVGRKWTGSDIPTSILEAAELFAKRMKATRAMKQLWEVRLQFMKYERGWLSVDDDTDVIKLSLEDGHTDETGKGTGERVEKQKKYTPPSPPPPQPGSIEERMALVENCYRSSLPHLQSLVLVCVKALLTHVTSLVTQASGPNGLQSGFQYQDGQNGRGANGGQANGVAQTGTVLTNEEIESTRTQEVLDKAVVGLLMLLLKWFKVSHILKFEYLTQLLLDASYIPLILKLLQLQETDKVVNTKVEQEELNFFAFCRSKSRHAVPATSEPNLQLNPTEMEMSDDSDGDALPPPIRRQRDDSTTASSFASSQPGNIQPPEVDELGNPTTPFPHHPITHFSWRALYTSITILRILQKLCKGKAHRNLMLVSYKSSQFLRKNLKIPEPLLRLYTLKLFKNQVPYCGRKWRQANMRVITACYLKVRPELRDDWLSGGDVDEAVEESVPLESALRGLTHWWNLRFYPKEMGVKEGMLDDGDGLASLGGDFFRRELEKMDWGLVNGAHGDGLAEDGDADGRGWDVRVDGW